MPVRSASPPVPSSAAPSSVPHETDERAPLLSPAGQQSYEATASEHNEHDTKSGHFNLAGLSARDFWVLILSMLTSVFCAAFDATIVSTLLGPISSSFRATNLASWLGTSYLLSVCCFTPIYGRLCNIIGRQASMLIALSFFCVGNVGCALAPTMPLLIASRAVAGVGGGGLQSVSSTIFSDLVPITHRGLFQGLGNIAFSLGTGLGAPLGGMINDAFGWRWAFGVQIPMMLVAIVLIYLKVRYEVHSDPSKPQETARQKLARIDFLGCFTLAGFVGAALIAVSLPTADTSEDAVKWTDTPVIVLFAISAVLLVAFIVIEWREKEPVLPLELLVTRTPIAVSLNGFLSSIIAFMVLYTVPLFFTTVILMSSSSAGQHLIPNSVCVATSSVLTGLVIKRTHRYYWLTVGLSMLIIFSAVLLATWNPNTPDWMLWTNVAPLTFAGGGVSTSTIVALIADVGRENVAIATSLSYVARTTGQVIGVALSGAITQSILNKELHNRIRGPDASKIIASIRESSDSIRNLPPDLRATAQASYAAALHGVFVTTIVFTVLAALSVLFIREVDMSPPKKTPEESEEPQDA